MATYEEYVAARGRRDAARVRVLALGRQLRMVADLLQKPEQVRVNEPTTMRISRPIPHQLDKSQLPDWDQIATALRDFLGAEDHYLSVDSSLTPEQRRHLKPD